MKVKSLAGKEYELKKGDPVIFRNGYYALNNKKSECGRMTPILSDNDAKRLLELGILKEKKKTKIITIEYEVCIDD